MKSHNILKEMRFFIEMGEDEFTHQLFHDEAFMARYNEAERFYEKMLAKMGKQKGSLQLAPICEEHSKHMVLITPSTRLKGHWQRTIFLNKKPMSHRDYNNLEEVVEDNAGEWFRHGLWMKE